MLSAEVIDTTANHPWLTADRGWLVAGALHIGESVTLLDTALASQHPTTTPATPPPPP